LHIRLDGERPTIESEERTVSKAEASVLRVHEVENGGVQVQGWDKDVYSVTACKAAVGGDAARLLSQIKLAVQGGEVSVSGPHGNRGDWTVYLLIRTPRSADIEVTTHNGPVSFYAVDGKITTRATNGPISMND
jgi:osmotically-inducible protein OsmY